MNGDVDSFKSELFPSWIPAELGNKLKDIFVLEAEPSRFAPLLLVNAETLFTLHVAVLM